MAWAQQVLVNPSNTNQRYILWSNGYIQPVGTALPVTQSEASVNSPYANGNAPTFYGWSNPDVAVALQIIDWSIPRGYTLTSYGHTWPWGGATEVPGSYSGIDFLTTAPEYLFGLNGGFVAPYGYISDFQMDPGNTGVGYLLTYQGDVIAIGTGVTAVSHSAFLGDALGWALEMDWTSKRYWILDTLGRIWGGNGGNTPAVGTAASFGGALTAPSYVWGRGGRVGFRLYDKAASPKGWMQDEFGRVYPVGAVGYDALGFATSGTKDSFHDIVIIDDGTGANPARLAQLRTGGGLNEFVISSAPKAVVIEPPSTNTTSTRPFVSWNYIDREGDAQAAYAVKIIASAVYTSGTTNEVQRVTITGTPTGGNFTLTFDGYTTSAIAYNASNATVQAALEALPNIGTGGVVVGGGALPGTFITVTFQNQMAAWDWPQMTAAHTFTGGTSPAIAVTTTTAGVGIDPATASNVGSVTGTDYKTNRVQAPSDLATTGNYRAFVRVTDTSGLNSSWSFKQFTQNVTALNTPSITPTVVGGLGGVSVAVSATTGAGLPGTARFCVQFHDSDWDGATWLTVRNGEALVPSGGGTATIVDYEARFGVVRTYRAITYVYDSTADTFNGSAFSSTQTATLTPRNLWTLTQPDSITNDTAVKVQPGFAPTHPIVSTTFMPVNREDPVVVTDGSPKYPTFELGLWALSNSARTAIRAMLHANATLLLRSPFGDAWYFRPVEEYSRELLQAVPLVSEATSVRDASSYKIRAQSVRRPIAGMTVGPLKEA